ncbi:MAG: GNAT family N-acetyltransferase [Bacillota bacterium]
MPHVRFWRESDLPGLLQMASITAWEIMNPSDKAVARPEVVFANAQRNLIQVLASPGGTAIVADEGGRPVGYLLIGLRPDDRTGEIQGYMADIYIQPPFRGKGLAAEFHRIGEDYLRRLGIRRATNWTHASNPLGRKASNDKGFRLWGVMMEKLLQPATAIAPQAQKMGLGV